MLNTTVSGLALEIITSMASINSKLLVTVPRHVKTGDARQTISKNEFSVKECPNSADIVDLVLTINTMQKVDTLTEVPRRRPFPVWNVLDGKMSKMIHFPRILGGPTTNQFN